MKPKFEELLQEAKERKQYFTLLCSELFPNKTLTLEIGCGNGHFLTSYAQTYPERICIGIDFCTQRILRAKRKQTRAKLTNLHFLKADAAEFVDALPDNTLIDAIFILFPDPWPKTRHHKNRLIQNEFLNLLSHKSLNSTKLHFRTDHEGYFDWTNNEIKKNSHWQLDNASPWPFEEETVFQKKMGKYQSLIASKI